MSDTPSPALLPATPPVSTSAAPSQSATVAPPLLLGRSGYLTSSFGMVIVALLSVATLALKDKLDPTVSGILLLGLPAAYAYLRNERALGHAKLNADIITGAISAAGAQVLAVRAPALLGVLGSPDANGQARAGLKSSAEQMAELEAEYTAKVIAQYKAGPDVNGQAREAVGSEQSAVSSPAATGGDQRDVDLATKAVGGVLPGLAMGLLISLSLALNACSSGQPDPVATHVQSFSLAGSGNAQTGDVGGAVTITLRDPRGLRK